MNPLASCSEDRIAHCRGNPSNGFFADAGYRIVSRADPMNANLRNFGWSQ
jgi:hypothetical protein